MYICNNSNASGCELNFTERGCRLNFTERGCWLNFTEREDSTVTLYSAHINKIQASVGASRYINLPVSERYTVIAFDILENEISDKAAVIYNELGEIKLITAMPNQTSTFINSV